MERYRVAITSQLWNFIILSDFCKKSPTDNIKHFIQTQGCLCVCLIWQKLQWEMDLTSSYTMSWVRLGKLCLNEPCESPQHGISTWENFTSLERNHLGSPLISYNYNYGYIYNLIFTLV